MFSGEKTKVVVWDAENGHPLIIEHRLGKGKVYLLTAWAYPGHDRLQQLCASFIAKLATESRGKYYVEDSSSEIFWTMWNESGEVNKMMLLNTDWSSRANIKPVKIITPSGSFPLDIFEREAYILTILPFAIVSSRGNLHIEVVEVAQTAATLKIHGNIRDQLHVMYANGKIESMEYNFDSNQCETIIKIAQ